MRVFSLTEKLTLLHLNEMKEMAFLAWQRSGYRDIAAHDEYLSLYRRAQSVLHGARLHS